MCAHFESVLKEHKNNCKNIDFSDLFEIWLSSKHFNDVQKLYFINPFDLAVHQKSMYVFAHILLDKQQTQQDWGHGCVYILDNILLF